MCYNNDAGKFSSDIHIGFFYYSNVIITFVAASLGHPGDWTLVGRIRAVVAKRAEQAGGLELITQGLCCSVSELLTKTGKREAPTTV